MASTGCGKTFANAKVMRALSDDGNSLRYILALGLRTLTLQTGDEYRSRVGLDNSELAVLIGSRAVMELHQQKKMDDEKQSFENTGSISQETLLDEEVDYDCAIPESGLSTVLTCDRDRSFLYAPVLVCTIDHMMAATETKRGGRYILPSLRLMSSDLVIDEIDDFTGNDLIAIGRLIHLAGMLGRKVMISSATIPPDLAEGYYKAYRDGWQLFRITRNTSGYIGCAWIDEFNTLVSTNGEHDLPMAISTYRNEHANFINRRVKKLKAQPAKRKADITACPFVLGEHRKNPCDGPSTKPKKEEYFNVIANSSLVKHQYHSTLDTMTGLSVSFGVIRIANISPCVDLTKYLLEREWPADTQVRAMAYHSQQVLLMRSEQERHLDQVLQRKEQAGEQPKAFSNSVIRQHLGHARDQCEAVKHVIFILIATPVEEVGRDHDFDWAVVEPSSYRSIVQLAGRVRRHREGAVGAPNVGLLQYNWKGIENYQKESKAVFVRPGFETNFRLQTHNLAELIDEKLVAEKLDAIPRIQKPIYMSASYVKSLKNAAGLSDLEHADTWRLLAYYQAKGPASLQGYLKESWFLTALPQQLTAFRQSEPSLRVFLVYDDYRVEYSFCEKDEKGHPVPREKPLGITRSDLSEVAKSRLWLERSFENAVETIADEQNINPRLISQRYGEVSFRYSENRQYEYNDQLGLVEI